MTDVQNLIHALTSLDGTARRQAALALGASRDDAVADALLDRLAVEPDGRVREDLTWAVVQHAGDARARLVEMLRAEDPALRRTAAHVLSKVASPDDFEAVAPLVADGDADVAIKAYRAAANTGGARAVDALVARLADGDQLQRDALTTALATVGEAVVPALIAALADDDAEVREHAAEALGHLGGPEADAAASALEALAADPVPAVRLAAVAALGELAFAADEPLRRIAAGPDPLLAQLAGRLSAVRS
ncbi:MAG: HEAT repeat domain-containing protein [Arachnia sp.]